MHLNKILEMIDRNASIFAMFREDMVNLIRLKILFTME